MLSIPDCPFLPSSPSRPLLSASPPLVSAIGSWGERRGWMWRSKTKAPAGLLDSWEETQASPVSLSHSRQSTNLDCRWRGPLGEVEGTSGSSGGEDQASRWRTCGQA